MTEYRDHNNIARFVHNCIKGRVLDGLGNNDERSLATPCPYMVRYINGNMDHVPKHKTFFTPAVDVKLPSNASLHEDLSYTLKHTPNAVKAINNYETLLKYKQLAPEEIEKRLFTASMYILSHKTSGDTFIQNWNRLLENQALDAQSVSNLLSGNFADGKPANFLKSIFLKIEGKALQKERKNFNDEELGHYQNVGPYAIAGILERVVQNPKVKECLKNEQIKIKNPEHRYKLGMGIKATKGPQNHSNIKLRTYPDDKSSPKTGMVAKVKGFVRKIGQSWKGLIIVGSVGLGIAIALSPAIGVLGAMIVGFAVGGLVNLAINLSWKGIKHMVLPKYESRKEKLLGLDKSPELAKELGKKTDEPTDEITSDQSIKKGNHDMISPGLSNQANEKSASPNQDKLARDSAKDKGKGIV